MHLTSFKLHIYLFQKPQPGKTYLQWLSFIPSFICIRHQKYKVANLSDRVIQTAKPTTNHRRCEKMDD